MDHKTRVRNAVQFKPVDRVPFDMYDESGYLLDGDLYDPAQRLHLSLADQVAARIRFHQEFDTDIIFDTPVIAEGQVPYTVNLTPGCAERYDLLSALFPLTCGVWHPWPPHIEPKPDVDTAQDRHIELIVEWENGISCELTVEMVSGTTAGYEVLMKTREEWPLWQETLTPRFDAFDYRYVDRIIEATGGDIALYGTIADPYSMFATLFGIEQSTYLLYDDPDFAGEVMDWLTDITIEVGKDMVRHGVDMLRIGAATASLLNPTLYREHVLPRHRRMNNALIDAGGIPVMHICGRSNALLEAVADADTPALETLTPPPLGDVELAEAKRRIGDRVCLKGNLDPVHVVAKLPPETVAAETRRCLETGSPGSGYILSVADCMVPGTPLENMQAIAETVHGFRVT